MIDGGVFLGRNPANGNALDAEQLVAGMDAFGVQASLAASYKSIFFDFREGNADLAAAAAKYPGRIIPTAVIQPWGFDSLRHGSYFKELRKQGFKALGLYQSPKYYDLQLESFLVRDIAKAAATAGLVLQIGLQNVGDLHKLADHYTSLRTPVLVRWMSGRAYHALAEVLHLGRKFPNFYFDVGSFTPSGAIAYLVKELGAERLYFTSNQPESFTLSSHALLQNAGLSAQDLQQIYTLTLARILGLKTQVLDLAPFRRALAPVMDAPKVDTHWHTDGWNLLEPCKDETHFPAILEKYRLQKIILSPIRALNYDMEKGNEAIFALAEKNPNYYALIVVDPKQPEKSLEQVRRYGTHEKCAGLKTIQDLYGMGLDHAAYEPLLQAAEEAGLTVMAHIPGMLKAAERFSRVTFVCAHATHDRVASMFGQPNIYFDLATSHHDAAETRLELFLERAGEDRLIFASDAPLMDPSWTLGKIASASFSGAQLEKIFKTNAEKAFPRLRGASKAAAGRRS